MRGEALELLDDSNSYWWAVKCLSTGEIGYIPAENIETPYEKLARFNRHRNVELATVKSEDGVGGRKGKTTRIAFAEYTEIFNDGNLSVSDQGESELGQSQSQEDEIDILQDRKPTERKPGGFLGVGQQS